MTDARPKYWWLYDLLAIAGTSAAIVAFRDYRRAVSTKAIAAAPAPAASSAPKAVVKPPVPPKDICKTVNISVHEVDKISDYMEVQYFRNTIRRNQLGEMPGGGHTYSEEISGEEVVLNEVVRTGRSGEKIDAFVRAGPRAQIVFQPSQVKAAIVTCGGLCPGLNTVIRELVMTLYYNYGVDNIIGIRNGYKGFYDLPVMNLTPEVVQDIHNLGGTILGSSRGGFDKVKIMDACVQWGVNQLYVIGGDGTHRAAHILYQESRERKLLLTVVGVPKTIDNDIGIIDRSFGFYTAVEQAVHAVKCAKVEAHCSANSVSIVKLMGRHAGFIAAHAVLASGDVDVCLIPEIPFKLDGDDGLLMHIQRLMKRKGNATIVIAEGAGEEMMARLEPAEGAAPKLDASGNKVLPEIGQYIRGRIEQHFASQKAAAKVFYIDPSYMIRSVPADAADQYQCLILAQNAVHGAMAGYTGMTVGLVNNKTVYIPIPLITSKSPNKMRSTGRTWERVLSVTLQPRFCHVCGCRVDFTIPFHDVRQCAIDNKKTKAPSAH